MRLVILDNAEKVAQWAALYVMKQIKDYNPGPGRYFVLGLPTGQLFTFKRFFFKPVGNIGEIVRKRTRDDMPWGCGFILL